MHHTKTSETSINYKKAITGIRVISLISRVFILMMVISSSVSFAQNPAPALVGYFHNWDNALAPYIPLNQVDARYNVIDVAFAMPKSGTTYKMEFLPEMVNPSAFISQLQTLQSQGKKVLISIGGATAPVILHNGAERDTFVATMSFILNTYGFDGIDIDLEGNSLMISGGTIASPVDQPVINLIEGIRQIMAGYYQQHQHRMMLTMAPETAYVQGGQSAYGSIWGAYLPVIDALRDSIEILHVQLYNSGTMFGIDGGIYTQGTADFIVAMCEAVIQGFNTSGGYFAGLPETKVAAGLPACILSAGGGYTDPDTVAAAIRYLLGTGPRPGTYTLADTAGYPGFRGMMTWSINWDAAFACGGSYLFAQNYEDLFGVNTSVPTLDQDDGLRVYPNPATSLVHVEILKPQSSPSFIRIFNSTGSLVYEKPMEESSFDIDLAHLSRGIYYLTVDGSGVKLVLR